MNYSLRVRLRPRDKDIKQSLALLGKLEQGELSDLIRLGMRKVLTEKGVLIYGNGHFEVAKATSESLGGLQLEFFEASQGNG